MFLQRDIENLEYGFAKRPRNIPTVLSPPEIAAILSKLTGKYWLLTAMLHGCGFRIQEALSLRVKDIDLHNHSMFVFRGKGGKDRYTLLPRSLVKPIQTQIAVSKSGQIKRDYKTRDSANVQAPFRNESALEW